MKRGANRSPLEKLFKPASIAVIGASNNPHKVGNNILRNLMDYGYRGKLFPINLKETSVLGLKAYHSLHNVPEKVELAVIAIPASGVPQAVEECGKKGVPFAIVISAGFSELGKEGEQLQQHLMEIAKKYSVRILGPNCLGVINLTDNINASFSSMMPRKGNIAFISQSGALCSSILSLSADEDFGFSKFISIGNKADLDESDLLEFLGQDRETGVILMYLESIKNGRRFLDIAESVSRIKPIIMVKAGRTEAGKSAVVTHTGAMAGEDRILDAALKQCGVIRVDCLDDMFDAAELFSKHTLVDNINLAILTNGGGLGVITVDSCARKGIPLAKLSDKTKARISAMLPSNAVCGNPVDIIGDADAKRFEKALKLLLSDKGVGIVYVIVTPQSMTEVVETAEAIIRLKGKSRKPILTNFIGKERRMRLAQELLNQAGLPNFEFPEMGVNAVKMLGLFNAHRLSPQVCLLSVRAELGKIREIINSAQPRKVLTLREGFGVLAGLKLKLPPLLFSNTLADHREFLKAHRQVVLKVDTPKAVHKTELKLVSGRISSQEQLEAEFTRLYTLAAGQFAGFKILAQPFVSGLEIIVGGLRDPVFGPVVSLGLGGIFTEALEDVSFRVAPVSQREVLEMLLELKGRRLLEGFRGMPKPSLDGIIKVVQAVSELMLSVPEIKEMELNPFMAAPEGQPSVPVDVRIILQ